MKILLWISILISIQGCAVVTATNQLGMAYDIIRGTAEELQRDPNESRNMQLPDGRWRPGYSAGR